MSETKIAWTKTFVEEFNAEAEKYGLPTLIIADGYIYKDLIHQVLGIGIKLEEEP